MKFHAIKFIMTSESDKIFNKADITQFPSIDQLPESPTALARPARLSCAGQLFVLQTTLPWLPATPWWLSVRVHSSSSVNATLLWCPLGVFTDVLCYNRVNGDRQLFVRHRSGFRRFLRFRHFLGCKKCRHSIVLSRQSWKGIIYCRFDYLF